MLSMSQFRSPNRSKSEDRWGAINSHMVSRAQLGAITGVNIERLINGEINKKIEA